MKKAKSPTPHSQLANIKYCASYIVSRTPHLINPTSHIKNHTLYFVLHPSSFVLLLAYCFLLLVSCGKTTKTSEAANTDVKQVAAALPAPEKPKEEAKPIALSQEQMDMMQVVLGKPEKRSLIGTITANGKATLLPNSMADVSVIFKGVIDKVLVKEGQTVKKGDPLFEVIAPDLIQFQEDLFKAKSELYFLNKELQRQQEMASQNVGAAKNLQDVQSKVYYQQTVIKTTLARLNLAGVSPQQVDDSNPSNITDRFTVHSPISGNVSHILASVGANVPEGTKLARLTNIDDLRADIFLYEKDIQKVKPGQTIHIQFTDPNIPETTGKIEYISKELDPIAKTIIARASFKVPAGKLVLPDMQLIATLETQNTMSLTIPDAAVMKDDEGKPFFFYSEAKDKDGKTLFKRAELEPRGQANGFFGVEAEFANKIIVVKGVNILYGESKRSEPE